MTRKYLASARLSLLALALGAAHVACRQDNEERFFNEMREDIDRTQQDGFHSGDDLDKPLVGSQDPRPRGSRGVEAPPPAPMFVPPPESSEASARAAGPDGNAGGDVPQKVAREEEPIPSFTNANIGAALAAYSAEHANGRTKDAKSSAGKRTDGGAP